MVTNISNAPATRWKHKGSDRTSNVLVRFLSTRFTVFHLKRNKNLVYGGGDQNLLCVAPAGPVCRCCDAAMAGHSDHACLFGITDPGTKPDSIKRSQAADWPAAFLSPPPPRRGHFPRNHTHT